MALPTPGVVLEELALVRYARRTGSQEVTVTGGVLTFTVTQEMFDADGHHLGVGRIELTGRREFGGTVRVDARPRLELPAASKEDSTYFESMTKDLLAVLPTLCRCGLIKPSCDCCAACRGKGTTPGERRAVICTACNGRGYVLAFADGVG